MILMGSWLVGEMKDSIPAGLRTRHLPVPDRCPARAETQTAIFGTPNNQVVAAQSENPATGIAWLHFIAQ